MDEFKLHYNLNPRNILLILDDIEKVEKLFSFASRPDKKAS